MRSHAFAPPLYLFVFAASARRQVIPPDCKMLKNDAMLPGYSSFHSGMRLPRKAPMPSSASLASMFSTMTPTA